MKGLTTRTAMERDLLARFRRVTSQSRNAADAIMAWVQLIDHLWSTAPHDDDARRTPQRKAVRR